MSEGAMVGEIDRWLSGAEWPYENATFAPYNGLSIRFRARGDQLTVDGVPVLSRFPSALLQLPVGTRTTCRTEAHALCAVAVRGDAGMYR